MASAASTSRTATAGIVLDMPVPASDGPLLVGFLARDGVEVVVDFDGVYEADSASVATFTEPPSTLTTVPAMVAAPGTAVVMVDSVVGMAIDGNVTVTPVMDAVALRVAPTVDLLVSPVPIATDGGVKATLGTLRSTSLSVLVAAPSTEVSCDGTALLPSTFSVPTFASAIGVGDVPAATAF